MSVEDVFADMASLPKNETIFIEALAHELLINGTDSANKLRKKTNLYRSIEEIRKDELLLFVCSYDKNTLTDMYNVCKYLNDPHNRRVYHEYNKSINDPHVNAEGYSASDNDHNLLIIRAALQNMRANENMRANRYR